MTDIEDALRREHARAVRYRESFSLLLLDRAPTTPLLEQVRDATRLCDAVIGMPDRGRVAVILPETPLEGAIQVANRVAGLLQDPPPGSQAPAIGVATHPGARDDGPAAMLRDAEKALAQALATGGGVAIPPAR